MCWAPILGILFLFGRFINRFQLNRMAHFPKMGKKPQGNFSCSLSGLIKLLGGDIAKFKHVARAQDFRGLEFGSPCYFKIHKMVLIIFFNGFQNLKDSK